MNIKSLFDKILFLPKSEFKISFPEVLFILAIALKPIYIWKSGGIQLSDFIFILLFCFFCLKGKIIIQKKYYNYFRIFVIAIFYQIIVNSISFIVCLSNGFMENTIRFNLFYIFNLMVVFLCTQLEREYGLNNLIRNFIIAIFIAELISFIGLFFNRSTTVRQTGFFNNPNQLGYFGVISLTVWVVFIDWIKPIFRIILIALSIFLVMNSLSKAALVSCAVLLILASFVNTKKDYNSLLKLLIILIILFLFFYLIIISDVDFFAENQFIKHVRFRLINMQDESDSHLGEGRGYLRVIEIGINAIWGVGEGNFDRFKYLRGGEVHSLYANLIVCYGLIGLILYLFLILRPLKMDNYKYLFMFSGILLYSVTHNGIRNTLLWTLLGILLVIGNNNDNSNSICNSQRKSFEHRTII